MRNGGLLEKIASQRMGKDIDKVLRKSRKYRKAVKQQGEALDRMDKLRLKKSQKLVIDSVISADNHCGAIYGEVAYRLGVQDGIRLVSEIKGIASRR